MRVLFATGIDINNPVLVGVTKKIRGQVEAMRMMGHDVVFCYIDKGLVFEYSDGTKNIVVLKTNSISSRLQSYQIYGSLVKKKEFDLFFIRMNEMNPFLLAKLFRIKRKKIKVIIELPTYPADSEVILLQKKLFTGKRYAKLLLLLIFRILYILSIPFVRYAVDAIITYSSHNKIWGIETISIANGIDVKEIALKSRPKNSTISNHINIIGVANLSLWHGFDRVIRGLAEYKSYCNEEKIVFNIVGTGPEEEALKLLSKELGISSWVVFHGLKNGMGLDKLFENADIAISSLGMHRIGLSEGAVLKTREYCARGIPFIYGYKDVGIIEKLPFALRISANESALNIEKLISFYRQNKLNKATSSNMRRYAIENLTWLVQMQKVFNDIQKG